MLNKLVKIASNQTDTCFLQFFFSFDSSPCCKKKKDYKNRASQQTLGSSNFAKGQIISECPYEIIVSPKIPTKKIPRFLSQPLRRGQIKNFIKPIMLNNP